MYPSFPGSHSRQLSSGRAQKPSSARPIQLKANRQQPNAATDAKVAIVFADDMTRTLCGPPNALCRTTRAQKWQEFAWLKKGAAVAVLQHEAVLARKNPQSPVRSRESDGEYTT